MEGKKFGVDLRSNLEVVCIYFHFVCILFLESRLSCQLLFSFIFSLLGTILCFRVCIFSLFQFG